MQQNPPLFRGPGSSSRAVRVGRDAGRRAGFSLVEVSLALGIVAFGFVALLGLLPAGLNTFRASVDTANELWIMQGLNSMVQVTEWPQVRKLGFDQSHELYYFDEEGRLVDSETRPDNDPAVRLRRLYAVKLVVDDFMRPAGESASTAVMPNAWRITALISPLQDPGAMADLRRVEEPGDLANLPRITKVRSGTFVAVRMDSEKSTP